MSTARKTPAAKASGPNPTVIISVVVGVVVLAAVAIVIAASGGGDDSGAPTTEELQNQYGIVTIQGEALPPMPEGGDDPAVGQAAPDVISERVAGQTRLEPAEEGRPTMAVFLAHWCPHCQRELPVLVEMAEDGAFDGVRTVAVLTNTTDTRPNFPPSAWLDEEGWTGDRLFDDEMATAGAAYGLSGFPMMVFTDAEGRVVQRLSGEQPREVIEAAISAARS